MKKQAKKMSDRNRIIELIKREESFNLISHMLPDGDSIGSLLALGRGLKKVGKKVNMFTPGHIPLKYGFLDGADFVKHDHNIFNPAFTVIVLDSSDADRLGDFKDKVLASPEIINIDHHVTNQSYGTLNHVNAEASATGEIVYSVLEDLEVELDNEIAEALYVAISTDTGSFKYDNTTPHTHRVIASLLQQGISPGTLSQKVFDERPLSFFILLKEALSSLEMYSHRTVAVMTTSKDIRIRSGATTDDLDGIVNYTRNIEGVELGILFYVETDFEVKVGFRSKRLDVSKLAGKLNGGGHIRAAGCRMQGSYETVKKKVLDEAFIMLADLPN
jgi:bifunctional oligoribonuclease and PAP phosphatase NrnA